MNAVLVIEEAVYAALWSHLFPVHDAVEQGAFLFLKSSSDGARMTFEVADIRMLKHADYVHQESHGLELTDTAHASPHQTCP